MMSFKKVLPAVTAVPLAFAISSAYAESPYLKPDDAWISIDGEVEKVSANSFTLDYGQGVITIEMDDADRDSEGYSLLEGDEVTVSGIIDDDFYEAAKIEASSVYVESIGSYFYASSVDEEDTFVAIDPVIVSDTIIQGTVSSVGNDQFALDTGAQKLTIEIDEMIYNPLDEDGYQQLEKGDTVSVTGHLDHEVFDGHVFDAESVITLMEKRKRDKS